MELKGKCISGAESSGLRGGALWEFKPIASDLFEEYQDESLWKTEWPDVYSRPLFQGIVYLLRDFEEKNGKIEVKTEPK